VLHQAPAPSKCESCQTKQIIEYPSYSTTRQSHQMLKPASDPSSQTTLSYFAKTYHLKDHEGGSTRSAARNYSCQSAEKKRCQFKCMRCSSVRPRTKGLMSSSELRVGRGRRLRRVYYSEQGASVCCLPPDF
jgi:hypothetical protein